MRIVRIFAGDDGRSRFEPVNLDARPNLKTIQAATGIGFKVMSVGEFRDFHPAPRRQVVITLEGEMEIGLEDGTTERFEVGDVLIAEDVKGRGHTLRITGDRPRVSVNVPLPS